MSFKKWTKTWKILKRLQSAKKIIFCLYKAFSWIFLNQCFLNIFIYAIDIKLPTFLEHPEMNGRFLFIISANNLSSPLNCLITMTFLLSLKTLSSVCHLKLIGRQRQPLVLNKWKLNGLRIMRITSDYSPSN